MTYPYGYYTEYGYMGRVNGDWMLFATEAEYRDYIEEDSDKSLLSWG